MRAAIAIALVILIIGPGYRPMPTQAKAGGVPGMESIRMIDALTGWAVTHEPGAERLLHTTNGGMHWTDVTPFNPSGGLIANYHVAVLTSLLAWVSSSDTATGTLTGTTQIFHTVDGGRTWRNVAIPALSATSIHFINPNNGWLLSMEEAGTGMGNEAVNIYRSTDGGATWIKVTSTSAGNERSGLPLEGGKMAITFLDATTGWVTGGGIVSDQLHLYVTHDGGHTWRQQRIPLPVQVTSPWADHPTPPKFFTARDGILAVGYAYGETQNPPSHVSIVVFYATHDGGTTWAYTTPVPATLTSWDSPPSFADMNHGWATNVNSLYATSDAGHQWTTIRPGPLFADVKQLDFMSPRVGWAVRQTFPFLLKTVDGGHTWAPVTYTISRQ